MFKPSHIFAFSLGAGLTLILMLFIGYGLDGDMGFCKLEAARSPAETPVTCAREWIGALSGWVAAITAFVIGFPTLKYLKAQAFAGPVKQKTLKIAETIEHIQNVQFQLLNPEITQAAFDGPTDKAALNFEYQMIIKSRQIFDILKDLSTIERVRVFNEIGYIELHKKKLKTVKILDQTSEFGEPEANTQYRRFVEDLRGLCSDAIDRLTKELSELEEWEKNNLLP